MRKLLALAIVFVLAGATRSWALVGLENLKFDGSLEVSGNSANNEADLGGVKTATTGTNDHRGVTTTRVRLGMNATVTEGVSSRLEVVRNNNSAASGSLYGGAAKPTSAQTELNDFVFHNAYVEFSNLWNHTVRLGRQYVGEAGDLVWHIGPKSDDSLFVSSIDGLSAVCNQSDRTDWMGKVKFVLFTGKASESKVNVLATDAAGVGDVNLSNIEVNLSVLPNNGRVRVAYLLGDASNTSVTTDNNHLRIARIGANGGIMENMWTYRAEYLQNMGQLNRPQVGTVSNLKYKGSAIDLGVGFNSKETPAGTFGINAGYFLASGDDKTDNDDKSFHDFSLLGVNTSDRYFGEIFGKSLALASGTPLGQGVNGVNSGTEGQGLKVVNIGVNWKPAFVQKTSVKLDYYTLSRDKDMLGASNRGSKFGNEIDLTVGYQHTENVGFDVGYATLSADEALDWIKTGSINGTQQDSVTKLFARANIKWGGEEK